MPRQPKAHLIDTNVLLRYLIGDVPPQAGKARALMERLEAGTERAEVLESVVAETTWTLESFYNVPRSEIAEKLATILSFKGVKAAQKSLLVSALAKFGGFRGLPIGREGPAAQPDRLFVRR